MNSPVSTTIAVMACSVILNFGSHGGRPVKISSDSETPVEYRLPLIKQYQEKNYFIPPTITNLNVSQRFTDASVKFLSGSRNFTPEEKSGYRKYLNTFFKPTGKKVL